MIAKYHVTYNSRNGDNPNQFCVHKEDGDQRIFTQSKQGLYYLDTTNTPNHVVLVNTVESNKSKYSDRDYNQAKLARKIQVLICRPKLNDFIRYIEGQSIPSCPIVRQDAINAEDIFGWNLGSLQGKTTQQLLDGITANIMNIPKEIMAQYRGVTLCIDIMFTNKIPFFLSISRNIRFITGTILLNQKATTIIKALKDIYGIYRKCGFRITNILGNSKFECTRGAVAADLKSELNICGEDEHVPDVEQCICTVKE
jgi:hypothetical protein